VKRELRIAVTLGSSFIDRNQQVIPPNKINNKLNQVERANLINDQARMFKSDQARTDHYFLRMLGVPIPDDEMIDISEKTIHNNSGISPLATIAIGLISGAVIPLAGLAGYFLSKAPAAVQQIEKIVEKPVETIITKPGKTYNVNVDMEVVPPES
jgi:hypothetical protein